MPTSTPAIRPWIATAALVVVAIAFVLLLFPFNLNSKAAAMRTACLSNVKQLALGLRLYSEDQGGLPPSSRWETAVLEGKEPPSCPEGYAAGGRDGYGLNGLLKSRAMEDPKTPLVLETKRRARNLLVTAPEPAGRHGGRTNVAFTDGHAHSIPDAEIQRLRLEPPRKTGNLTPNMPQLRRQ